MITQLARARHFGPFQDWRWLAELRNFRRYNLAYGWNYSGKTTLSRIFATLQTGSPAHAFPSGTAVFRCAEPDRRISSPTDDASDFPPIAVFNRDFINQNLEWSAGSAQPVVILGEDQIDLIHERDGLRDTIAETEASLRELRNHNRQMEETIQTTLTNYARRIKQQLNIPDYDRTKLRRLIDGKGRDGLALLEGDTYAETHATAFADTRGTEKPQLPHQLPDLEQIEESVYELLHRPITAETIPELEHDSALNSWVHKGRDLHKDRATCGFCGNTLPTDLLERLDAHFSDEYARLLRDIDTCDSHLSNSYLSIQPSDEDGLQPDQIEQYRTLLTQLTHAQQEHNAKVQHFQNELARKRGSPFHTLERSTIPSRTIDISHVITQINEICNTHNERVRNFEHDKTRARDQLIEHRAGEAVEECDYWQTQDAINRTESEIHTTTERLEGMRGRYQELDVQLRDSARGADVINQCLRTAFGRDDLTLAPAGDADAFSVYRGDERALELSEGERTAIAFAYFLAKVDEIDAKLEDLIIFLDDPVSSLDSNHIFTVYSLIVTRLSDAKQLFVTTHNFEFFLLLRSWLDHNPPSRRSFYLIRRFAISGNAHSKLEHLPKSLQKFSSEYQYLFSILYEFDKNPSEDEFTLHAIPNLVRRFLESFASFKKPQEKTLRSQLDSIVSDPSVRERILKFVQEHSHETNFAEGLWLPDLAETSEVVSDVLQVVRCCDESHYEGLKHLIEN